jgi:outer membrane lipoprotein SlyB
VQSPRLALRRQWFILKLENVVKNMIRNAIAATLLLGAAGIGTAQAQTSVQYGRITDVRLVDVESRSAQNTGALVGGMLGAASGSSGRSGSNRALRGVGGAAVGSRVGASMGRTQAFEYTVLLPGNQTTRIRTEQAGLRSGDCVAVERGSMNNIRLVADDRCAQGATTPPRAVETADACTQAKEQLMAAETDEDFDRAERRVRLVCN